VVVQLATLSPFPSRALLLIPMLVIKVVVVVLVGMVIF